MVSVLAPGVVDCGFTVPASAVVFILLWVQLVREIAVVRQAAIQRIHCGHGESEIGFFYENDTLLLISGLARIMSGCKIFFDIMKT